MASLTGSDDWNLGGYGVLGTARPRTLTDQSGNQSTLNSYGVWGLLATDGDIPGVIEFATGFDPGQPQRAAVGGRNTLPDQGMAVYGECRGLGDSPGANMFGDPPMRGFLAGTDFVFQQPVGAYGEATNGDRSVGVMGYSGVASTNKINGPTGVLGTGTIGVRGETGTGVGVLGRAFDPSGQAGVFMGSVKVTGAFTAASISVSGTIEVLGSVNVDGDVFLRNRDVAENFAAAGEFEAGSVMVMGDDGLLRPCTVDYDSRAIGIISGAGTLRHALLLGYEGASGTQSAPIAMVGTAFCKVDASRAAIHSGDLLTPSATIGHAMKATDRDRSFGAVIGKALGSLAEGCGLIPVLVSMQ